MCSLVRWTGWFVPQISGDQVFQIRADGGVLFVNGQKLFDDWNKPPLPPNKSGPTPAFSGKIHLQAGQSYSVQIDYHRVVGFTPYFEPSDLQGIQVSLASLQRAPKSRARAIE
jgi:beta-glucosidase